MNRVAARAAAAAAAGAVLVVVGFIGWWGVDTYVHRGVGTDGPVESFTDGGTGEVGGTFHGEMIDWADVNLTNTSPDPAVITQVKLLPGYGSDGLIQTDGFFVLGLDRSFGGGLESAPSDASFWGVEPEPAIGYEIPGTAEDTEGIGVTLMIRLGIGDQEDGSFEGIEVYYTWHGDEYKAYFNQAMLLCDHDKGDGGAHTGICRGDHPPPKPIT